MAEIHGSPVKLSWAELVNALLTELRSRGYRFKAGTDVRLIAQFNGRRSTAKSTTRDFVKAVEENIYHDPRRKG